MKKFLRSMLCIIAAAAVCSLCGCTVSKSGNNKDGGVIKPDAESAKDGTVAYTYEYEDKKGEKKTEKVDIDVESVDKIEFVEKEDLKREKFVSDIAPSYGMSEEEAKKAVDDKSEFKEFRFTEYIENKSDKKMAFKQLKIEDNGKNNIWINADLGMECALVPGAIYPVDISGIADMSKYDEETVEKAFKEMKIKLEYTLINKDDIEADWEKADVQTMDIH